MTSRRHFIQVQATTCPTCQSRLLLDPKQLPAAACPFCGDSPAEQPAWGDERGREHAAARQQSMQAREAQAQVREAYRQQLRLTLQASGLLPPSADLVVLPSVDREIVPLAEERKRKFLGYLEGIAQQALAERDEHPPQPSTEQQTSAPASLAPVRETACRLCRGSCCLNGGEHGYLLPASLLRWLGGSETWTVEQVTELYRSFLPESSIRESCVFHTEHGCNLPRRYRSDTCNAFICQGLAEYETHAEASTREVLVTANRHGEVVRMELTSLDERQEEPAD
jgi:hypothetical protein